ncbi:TPA: hypothetical protein H2W67_002155 [Salmonella enterica]|uniref:Uncharacterized protein n=1 Tax=Salmonella enterica TaxID=28901 RepID=A0A757BBA1_SALER|nr:hypothetical protein [Salmonella enterica subsp. enterica serovar Typhimurium]HAG0331903.1 hypothetical protein [Salmonella enterica]HAK0337374.1 hypothetical protein [Salmonella enterica]HAK0457916.1 hypothetical protein [Salmonella enterica]HAK0614513.1 hypothetical protein [Salmonella enterica]
MTLVYTGNERDVFPAPAGINRDAGLYRQRTRRVPRASGDKPVSSVLISSLSCVFPAPAGISRVTF